MIPIVITGIGTGIGKTLVSAIITEALQADYWKPVQAGYENGTDSTRIRNAITNTQSTIHPEAYVFGLAASPHIAAREEGIRIEMGRIKKKMDDLVFPPSGKDAVTAPAGFLVIEGAGGLMAPLNEDEFAADLFKLLGARVILVSRNYLGSINHSLLTAIACRHYGLDVIGWIFNDQYLHYEQEIVGWTGIPLVASIPFCDDPGRLFVRSQATALRPVLSALLAGCPG
jgi:dethiobiotin synthetase